MTETGFLLNTFFLLICGAMVMFMALGFAMLEAGTVRSKSVAVILVKNIGLYALAGVLFYLVGYDLMYQNVDGGFFGMPGIWHPDDAAALDGDYSAGYASAAGWFFQMVFVATAASIVSGALAERIKLWPFFLFCALLCAFIYPVAGSWVWGGGWLSELGFKDFAGSTLVHSVGGWAALTGAVVLGPRRVRLANRSEGLAPVPPSSLPLVTLGTFVLWFGWFGFNGGSQLSMSSTADAIAVAKIFANTNMAAAAAICTILGIAFVTRQKVDVPTVMNAALAGLVAITAEPFTPSIMLSMVIGMGGALVMLGATKLLEIFMIDDAVGAVPVHLAAGILGTLAVPLSNHDAHFGTQLIGIAATGIFVSSLSYALWFVMNATAGLRLHWQHEELGSDIAELGVRAYNLDFDEAIPQAAE